MFHSIKMTPIVMVLMSFLLIPGTQAALSYNLNITSEDFQPGHVVTADITGPINMTFSIRIVDSQGNIVGGRDDTLNATGKHLFLWTPSQDDEYNATVTFATGFTINKKFLIQQKVSSRDIAELYQSLFATERRLEKILKDVNTMATIGILLGGISLAISGFVGRYVRKNVSRAESEFEKFLKSDVEGVLRKLLDSKPRP